MQTRAHYGGEIFPCAFSMVPVGAAVARMKRKLRNWNWFWEGECGGSGWRQLAWIDVGGEAEERWRREKFNVLLAGKSLGWLWFMDLDEIFEMFLWCERTDECWFERKNVEWRRSLWFESENCEDVGSAAKRWTEVERFRRLKSQLNHFMLCGSSRWIHVFKKFQVKTADKVNPKAPLQAHQQQIS